MEANTTNATDPELINYGHCLNGTKSPCVTLIQCWAVSDTELSFCTEVQEMLRIPKSHH